MFTIDQIKEAHKKVKTGADFPQYISDLIGLGIVSYNYFVSDRHAVYFSKNNSHIQSPPAYAVLTVAKKSDEDKFRNYLQMHQKGETDYASFCQHAAETGIVKWTVNLKERTCTYYDKMGNAVLKENIPVA